MKPDITTRQFLELLRSGLWGTKPDETLFAVSDTDWKNLYRIAYEQTVLALVFDGILKLPSELRPNKLLSGKWISAMIRIEESNRLLDKAVASMASLYNAAGVPFVLVKGQGVAREYSNPSHRQCGDIDVYVGRDFMDKADAALLANGGKYTYPTDPKHKHSNISWRGITVENHWNLSDFHNKSLSARVRKWERNSMESTSSKLSVKDQDIKIPDPDFNTLYLLIHGVKHFMTMGLGLRQLCDWAMVLHNHSNELDRDEWIKKIEWLGLEPSFKAFGCLAVRYLGLDPRCLPYDISGNEQMADMILFDILENGNFGKKAVQKRYSETRYSLHRRIKTFIFLIRRHLIFRSLYPGEADVALLKTVTNAIIKAISGK